MADDIRTVAASDLAHFWQREGDRLREQTDPMLTSFLESLADVWVEGYEVKLHSEVARAILGAPP